MSEDVAASKELARRMKKEKDTYRDMVEAKMAKMRRRKESGTSVSVCVWGGEMMRERVSYIPQPSRCFRGQTPTRTPPRPRRRASPPPTPSRGSASESRCWRESCRRPGLRRRGPSRRRRPKGRGTRSPWRSSGEIWEGGQASKIFLLPQLGPIAGPGLMNWRRRSSSSPVEPELQVRIMSSDPAYCFFQLY